MNYAEVRDYALQLINQYSIAGTVIPGAYSNQQDYIERIPALVNDALMYIATSVRYIPANFFIAPDDGETCGRYIKHRLPTDFIQMRGSGLLDISREGRSRMYDYVMLGRDHILISQAEQDPLILEYYRTPVLLAKTPGEDDALDGDPETHTAVAYYVAYHLILGDDAFQYASLQNEYENKIARLQQRPNDVSIAQTEDVYGLNLWG